MVQVQVPPNATARVVLPRAFREDVMERGLGESVQAECAPSLRLEGREDDRLVYTVGSGSYEFVVAR